MRELKPDLEQLSGTMNVLSPGSVVAGELAIQMETTLARLQSLDPPEPLSATHKQACEALSKLLGGWVKAPNGELVLAVGSDPAILDGSRTHMRDLLLAFDSFEAQSGPAGQQN